ncbi:uncharacterized protein LOC128997879 [Macrosteles quadrilineatus]|uniref:uncharacterized protein LOC128997879 n=1 Tax=Macrosteles quadrilineatus TaxID=74068 RepID=UPI0023E0BF53|nr:uncharacterized protein LOC128997879 [Macrosteles quadrilineatus]
MTMYSLRIISLVMCAGLALGADVGSTTTATAGVTADPWDIVPSLLLCASSDSPTACVQTRAIRALEDLGDKEDDPLPKGVSPAVARVIDRIGDLLASGLSQWYPADTEEGKSAGGDNDIEQARGHKKKVKKAIKKAILKLIIVGLLIKQKIKMLLMAAQTFLQFKFLLVAIVYVVSNIVKIWLDIKSKHHPQKVIYYENAHHQHHYEPEHHDFDEHEHGGGWGGLWGRSIVATEPTPTNSPYHSAQGGSSGSYDNYPRSMDAQDIVYRAHKQ